MPEAGAKSADAEDGGEKSSLQSMGKAAEVALACGAFCVCSASMLLLNKIVTNDFPLTATVVIIQMSFACLVLPTCFFWAIRFGSWRDTLLWSSTVPWLFSAMMVTSIAALQHCSVGASNVVRNISPIITLPIETLLLETVQVDVHTFLSLGIILSGVVLYVKEDVHTEMIGLVLLVVNMLFAITDRIVQRRFVAVKPLDLSKTAMILLNNSIGLIPQGVLLIPFHEPQRYREVFTQATTLDYVVLGGSCIVGVGIGWTAVNAQRYVSATTFMVLGNANKVVVWIVGMVFMGEAHTLTSIIGAVIALSGGLYYGWSRMQLDAQNKAAKAEAAKAATESTPLKK